MFRAVILVLPLASACLIPIVPGNGGGGVFDFRYTEDDYLDDFADAGCEYVAQCMDDTLDLDECEEQILVGVDPCPNFIPQQARTCIDDIEEATWTCAPVIADDESACANVCG